MKVVTETIGTRSHYVVNLFWKRLWTCCKTDYIINVCILRHILSILGHLQ